MGTVTIKYVTSDDWVLAIRYVADAFGNLRPGEYTMGVDNVEYKEDVGSQESDERSHLAVGHQVTSACPVFYRHGFQGDLTNIV